MALGGNIKALSIWQPWADLLAHGYKDIENRDWFTPYRGLVLFHAGQKVDENAKLIGLARSIAPDQLEKWLHLPGERGGIVGYGTLRRVVMTSDSPWFRGRYGFVFTDCHPVPLIACRGQLKLFEVPTEVEEKIREHIRKEK